MKQIMKQLATAACLLTTVCMTVNAQQRSHLQSAIEDINSHVHFKGEILSSRHEQGRDQIDSLYYVREETLTFPYKNKKDKKTANEYIQEIVMGYQDDVNNAYSAFAFNADLESQGAAERTLSIFYSDNHPTYLVGKDGHSYVLIRKNSPQNPEYRNVYGVEWWLDKRQKRICFRCFDIFGPLHSPGKGQDALMQKIMKDFSDKNWKEYEKSIEDNYANETIKAIHMLGSMYKNDDSPTDKAIIQSVNVRVRTLIFNPQVDNNLRMNLFKELDAIPGYSVEIIRPNGENPADKERITFGELATRYRTLDIICKSWKGETDLYVRSLDKRYRNGVLQITLK